MHNSLIKEESSQLSYPIQRRIQRAPLTEAITGAEEFTNRNTRLVHPQAIIKCIPPDGVYFGF